MSITNEVLGREPLFPYNFQSRFHSFLRKAKTKYTWLGEHFYPKIPSLKVCFFGKLHRLHVNLGFFLVRKYISSNFCEAFFYKIIKKKSKKSNIRQVFVRKVDSTSKSRTFDIFCTKFKCLTFFAKILKTDWHVSTLYKKYTCINVRHNMTLPSLLFFL